MDAIIGKYRVCMEENGLTLKHAVGINFDLTVDEALGLLDFINAYRATLLALQEEQDRDTEPRLKRVILEKDNI